MSRLAKISIAQILGVKILILEKNDSHDYAILRQTCICAGNIKDNVKYNIKDNIKYRIKDKIKDK